MSAVANQKALRRMRRLRAEKRVQPAAPVELGFTLLEVMVAVAILAFSLVSIFSGEIGAIRMASRARLMTTASLLARCKMGEIEEEMMRTGFPAVSSTGSDECCQGGEVDGFTCEWEISRVVLPDQMAQEGEGEDGGPLGGLLGGAAPAAGAPAMPAGPMAPEAMLSGSMVAGGGDMISQMAMQMVFPMLKPSIEEQTRRATVTVRWEEGSSTQQFDVVQYLVAEQLNSAQMGAVLGQPGGAPPGGQAPPPGQKP
jgi:general secretion pathway protein I